MKFLFFKVKIIIICIFTMMTQEVYPLSFRSIFHNDDISEIDFFKHHQDGWHTNFIKWWQEELGIDWKPSLFDEFWEDQLILKKFKAKKRAIFRKMKMAIEDIPRGKGLGWDEKKLLCSFIKKTGELFSSTEDKEVTDFLLALYDMKLEKHTKKVLMQSIGRVNEGSKSMELTLKLAEYLYQSLDDNLKCVFLENVLKFVCKDSSILNDLIKFGFIYTSSFFYFV